MYLLFYQNRNQNSRLGEVARKVRARTLLESYYLNASKQELDSMVDAVWKAHDSHGKKVGELSSAELAKLNRILRDGGVRSSVARREIIEQGLAGNPNDDPLAGISDEIREILGSDLSPEEAKNFAEILDRDFAPERSSVQTSEDTAAQRTFEEMLDKDFAPKRSAAQASGDAVDEDILDQIGGDFQARVRRSDPVRVKADENYRRRVADPFERELVEPGSPEFGQNLLQSRRELGRDIGEFEFVRSQEEILKDNLTTTEQRKFEEMLDRTAKTPEQRAEFFVQELAERALVNPNYQEIKEIDRKLIYMKANGDDLTRDPEAVRLIQRRDQLSYPYDPLSSSEIELFDALAEIPKDAVELSREQEQKLRQARRIKDQKKGRINQEDAEKFQTLIDLPKRITRNRRDRADTIQRKVKNSDISIRGFTREERSPINRFFGRNEKASQIEKLLRNEDPGAIVDGDEWELLISSRPAREGIFTNRRRQMEQDPNLRRVLERLDQFVDFYYYSTR